MSACADIDHPGQFSKKQVMMGLSLPCRVGEIASPGNSEEKIRCEASIRT
jgi:hypothetical protein